MQKINKIINAVAPIRICDIGGWTDTWFAGHGAVFNIAVYPYVEVQIKIKKRSQNERITIDLENFGDTYLLNPEKIEYNKHPLIEAAIDSMEIPDDLAFTVNIFSSAPPGASTGTSAAVSVALIGALNSLTKGSLTAHEVAAMAHLIETEKLNLQCGIQDQICSAYGGINFIQMHNFPHSSVSPLLIPNKTWWELENRLVVIYIGTPHSSSEIHQKVIADLGCDAHKDERLNKLRKLAFKAKDALSTGNFNLFGKIMNDNTDVQRKLHKELICDKFEEIIDVANTYKCCGVKVNGAGGDGGSVTILTDGNANNKRKMIKDLQKKGYKSLNIYLSRYGLRVWS